ncbi:MAG TPA: hypothetical protein PLV42_07665 [bacterium]|nr:hypothetical protein [bacterium]
MTAFLDLLDQFKPKKNARTHAVELLIDIARRDGISPEAVLEKAGYAELVARPGHPLENFDELTRRLEAIRYPLWSAKKERLNALAASFKAKTGATLTYPDFADGDTVTLSLKVKSVADLADRLATLDREKEMVEKALRELGE